MIHSKLQDVVIPLPQPSKLANVLLRRLNVTQVDFMHIDAGHEYGSCREDVLVWWPLLRHSGILMGDDYSPNSFPGVVKAAKEFVLQCELDKFFSLDGNKWIVRKPSADWFAEHPDLPPFCTQGDTSHMVGVVKGN